MEKKVSNMSELSIRDFQDISKIWYLDTDTNDYYTYEEIIAYYPDMLDWKVKGTMYEDRNERIVALISPR